MKNVLAGDLIGLSEIFGTVPQNEEKFKCFCGETLGEVFVFGDRQEDKVYMVHRPHIKIVCGMYIKCEGCQKASSTEEMYAFCHGCYPEIHKKIMRVIDHINPKRTPQIGLGCFTTIKEFPSNCDITQQIKVVHQGAEEEFVKILSCVRKD